MTEEEGRKKPGLPFQAPQGVPKPRARMKQFKLNDVTVPLEPIVANQLVSGALSRIIDCESEYQIILFLFFINGLFIQQYLEKRHWQ